MRRPTALVAALELHRRPTLITLLRRRDLPDNVLEVIRIAAGCGETITSAAMRTRVSPERLQAAAVGFVEQVMFAASADHYRVLGASPGASAAELRRHMRWLMRWLHPDLNPIRASDRASIDRVLQAWEVLKDPARRADFDRKRRETQVCRARNYPSRHAAPAWIGIPVDPSRNRRIRLLGQIATGIAVLVLLVGIASRTGFGQSLVANFPDLGAAESVQSAAEVPRR